MADRPLCFVLMPFGVKPDGLGGTIDFDSVYSRIIRPAVKGAGMDPLRADQEMDGGIIHKPMFERLILCDYAIADLTTANANVYYELGIRHAVRPHSTVLAFAEGHRLPFDVAPLRAVPYVLGPDGRVAEADEDAKELIQERLINARNPAVDSPLFELLEDYPDVDHTKTDVFRDRVLYSSRLKEAFALARDGKDLAALHRLQAEISPILDQEAGVIVDLSYRALTAWKEMVALIEEVGAPLSRTVLVREQLGFALNRLGERDHAERVLVELIKEKGPSSETLGILGRVHKDRWEAANRSGNKALAHGMLRKAIDAYARGFQADWRDAYPGINAVTLMEIADPPDERRIDLIPVVAYAATRRIEDGVPDYWDHATRLELAILAHDQHAAMHALGDAVASIREVWEPETTVRNLRLIREAREGRGQVVPWARGIEEELAAAMDDALQGPADP